MPHLHDCKIIADFVEQGGSEVEWVHLRGGRREKWRAWGEWRKEQGRRKGSECVRARGKKERVRKMGKVEKREEEKKWDRGREQQ